MRTLRTWVVWSVGSLVLLVSPAVALLLAVTAETLIDVLIEARMPTVFCLVIAWAIGWVPLRNRSLNTRRPPQWDPQEEADQAAIAAPPR
jgi:hypothetical protein